jgi:transcriptional regulator with XRE-family HTH domain
MGSDGMDIGARLKQIRKEKRVSVYKLSKETYISENHIHGIEKGRNQPTVMMLRILLNYLGVSLSAFFSIYENAGEPAEDKPTEMERQLLTAIHKLPDEKAQAVFLMARLLSQ